MEEYLRETAMLNFSAFNIQQLMSDRKWREIDTFHRIKQIYNFVRDEILFGYNVDDSIPASKVLADGMGNAIQMQSINSTCIGAFCGYGVAVKDFRKPIIDFERNNTYIQSEGINQDFGIYDCPDNLLKEHRQEMSAFKAFLYRNIGRHLMNRNIKKIRNSV